MRVVVAACRLVGGSSPMQPWGDFEHHVVSAFGEAFNNVVLHGYAQREGDLEVQLEPRHDGITMRLYDHGAGFDLGGVAEPDLDALPTSGMGLFIIRSCMDDVEYLSGAAGAPNVLTLGKRLGPSEGQRTAA